MRWSTQFSPVGEFRTWLRANSFNSALAVCGALSFLLVTREAWGAAKTLEDFRYFRALSIDLQGRMPTRAEVAAFEKDDFDTNAWIDAHLQGSAYAERVRRIYMDLMRLEVGNAFQFVQGPNVLRRYPLLGPQGQTIYVYYRRGQRRVRPETDGVFCLDQAETGLQFPANAAATGTPINVAQATLDKYTKKVKPWWLYRDYTAPNPSIKIGMVNIPGFTPNPGLMKEFDGSTTNDVYVCAEEASLLDTGTIYASGRTMKGVGTPPYGRLDFPPLDSSYATKNAGQPIDCNTNGALSFATDCGCGVGLEHCMPGDNPGFDPGAFTLPTRVPLGWDMPFDNVAQNQSAWSRMFWAQEAVHFLDMIVGEDHDFREVLTSKADVINGPLAQFYREIAPASCCGNGIYLGYTQGQQLFDPAKIPTDLLPHDVTTWRKVDDRGSLASGLLTMPVFLTKYGTRRARAHVLWQAFACKDFIAENLQLMPSTEPDLTKRAGCQACHATLEPLAAYFSRIQESSFVWLPQDKFPVDLKQCAAPNNDITKIPGYCSGYYDPAFTSSTQATLRGAYASSANADAGPAGMAAYLTGTSQFETCVAQNVTESFLGRALTPDDQVLQQALAQTLAGNGYRMKALVKALVVSDAYKKANNLSSTAWRTEGGGQ